MGRGANAPSTCLADTLAECAKTADTTLSEMVNDDGSCNLKGDGSSSDFHISFRILALIVLGHPNEPDADFPGRRIF